MCRNGGRLKKTWPLFWVENNGANTAMAAEPKLGISACLLGMKVRYDGGHSYDQFIVSTLSGVVNFVPLCPESEAGMGTPREPMRLVGDPEAPRLLTVNSRIDHTGRLFEWAAARVVALEAEGLCGFIFKSGSPTSGMRGVRVYDRQGRPSSEGVGVFARAFMEHFPLLPVIDDTGFHDSEKREKFIERILGS